MKKLVVLVVLVAAMTAKADYWMTFCKTPGGQRYSQVGYVKPDADGFVTIKAGPLTVVVTRCRCGIRRCLAKRQGINNGVTT